MSFFVFLMTIVLNPVILPAQTISITANVDKNRLALDDQLVFQVTVSGDVSNLPAPTLPGIQGFTAYSRGTSQNVSFVNGRVSSSVTYNYALVPQSPGTFTIGSVILRYKNQEYKSEPITVEVVKSQQSAAQGQPASGQQQATTASKGRNIFITTSLDKKTAYVGEQITLSFKFYRNINIMSNPNYVAPNTTGFWAEDLPPQLQYYANVDGSRYVVVEIRTALFPTSPGRYTIGEAQLQCSVSNFSPDDFFGGFFSQGNTQVLKSNPIIVNVLPLPEAGKPPDFSGAVGSYRIKTNLEGRISRQTSLLP